MTTTFDLEFFREISVCDDGLARVVAFGGAIENTREGWLAYIAANPDAWRAPVFTAWLLKQRGWAIDPFLVWKIARLAFREAGKVCPALAPYAETLGPSNWRAARRATAAARSHYVSYAVESALAANSALDAAYAAAAAALYALYSSYAAAAAAAADGTRARVKSEILEMVIAALVAADRGHDAHDV